MNKEQRAAYINAQATAALIEAMGMVAENQQRAYRGEAMAYVASHFEVVIEK